MLLCPGSTRGWCILPRQRLAFYMTESGLPSVVAAAPPRINDTTSFEQLSNKVQALTSGEKGAATTCLDVTRDPRDLTASRQAIHNTVAKPSPYHYQRAPRDAWRASIASGSRSKSALARARFAAASSSGSGAP